MLTQEQINAAAQRLVASLHPKKVILFGSYARGTATEDSDLDLMVVEPEIKDEWKATLIGQDAVRGTGKDVDVLIYDYDTFELRKGWCSSPIHWAIKEGKVLYEEA